MKNRFEELIHSLDNNDFISLLFFVHSSTYTKNKKIQLLYNQISNITDRRTIKVSSFKKDFIAQHKVSDANFRMLLTDFSNLLEKFIIITKSGKDELLCFVQLLKFAHENDMEILFNSTLAKIENYCRLKKDFLLNELFLRLEYLNYAYLFTGQTKYQKRCSEVLNLITVSSKLELVLSGQSKHQNLNSEGKLFSEDKDINNAIIHSNSFINYQFLIYQSRNLGIEIRSEIEKLFSKSDSSILKILCADYLIYSNNEGTIKIYNYAKWLWQNSNKRYKIVNADKILEIVLEHDLVFAKNIISFLNINEISNQNYFSKCMYYVYLNDFKGCLIELGKLNPHDNFEKVKIRQLRMLCYIRLRQYTNFQKSYDTFRKFVATISKKKEITPIILFLQTLNNIVKNKNYDGKLSVIKNKLSDMVVDNKTWLEDELKYFISLNRK